MSNRPGTSCRWPTTAFTLVETVVGMLLLGSLLTAIVVMNGRLAAQGQRARQGIEACRVLDDLIDAWWVEPKRFPRRGGGTLSDPPGWRWRARTVPVPAAQAAEAEVVRVEVLAPQGDAGRPAAFVEVLLPLETAEDTDHDDQDAPEGPDPR